MQRKSNIVPKPLQRITAANQSFAIFVRQETETLFCDELLIPKEDLAALHISQRARERFEAEPAARMLFAFARMKNKAGTGTLLPQLEKHLLEQAGNLDCGEAVHRG